MTTIAFRDGVLASDSHVVFDQQVHVYDVVKIVETNDGKFAGACGKLSQAARFLQWIVNPGKRESPISDPDVSGFTVDEDGVVTIYDDEGSHEIELPYNFFALGSGQEAALAAMHMGATAEQAIEIAGRVCKFTGGRIQVLRFKDAV